MNELANHEGKQAVKKIDAEAMNLNYSEYVYHFLGKKKNDKKIDIVAEEKKNFKVSVDDFEFLRLLGTGGFSKVNSVH